MKLLTQFLNKRPARAQWDAGLAWFRLRYLEAGPPTHCLNLLSRPEACGRIALYYRPDKAVSQLYLGIPVAHAPLLRQMAADFGFSLKPKLPEVILPQAAPMTPGAAKPGQLPWDKTFVAHIVNEYAFVSLVGDDSGRGSYLPVPPAWIVQKPGMAEAAAWCLPEQPPAGLTVRPIWNASPPPAHWVASRPDPQRWLLGRSGAGVPLHLAGQLNLYGRQESVVEWLVYLVINTIAAEHRGVVVIDGAGDLVPRLKRQATVTRLFGERLTYLDIDGTATATGFNPLAAVPGETAEATWRRWQCWFAGLNVPAQGIQLLAAARQAGVADMPALRKWLTKPEWQSPGFAGAAVTSLEAALNRLTADPVLREWLEWSRPSQGLAGANLPGGALFFACAGRDWARQQLLRAALLGVMVVEGTRLIVHGFPWEGFEIGELQRHDQLIVTNGPRLPGSTVLLVESHPQGAAALAQRFLPGDARLQEHLELLGLGEALILSEERLVYTSWQLPAGRSPQPGPGEAA
jgi:hypothetical protein